ncbi:MAG: translation initiation factor IF-2 [bacterium]
MGHTSACALVRDRKEAWRKLMARVRVYEIARELGVPNKELVSTIRAMGVEVRNHMSTLDPDDVAQVKRALEKVRQDSLEERRVKSTVIRRRSKTSRKVARGEAPEAAAKADTAPVAVPVDDVAPPTRAAPEPEAPVTAAAASDEASVPGPAKDAPATAAPETAASTAAPTRARTKRAVAAPKSTAAAAGGPLTEPLREDAAPEPELPQEAPAVPSQAADAAEDAPEAPELDLFVAKPDVEPAPADSGALDEKLGPTGRFIDLNKASVPRVVITDLGQKPGSVKGRREYFPRQDRRGPPGRFAQQDGRGGKGKRKQVRKVSQGKTEITTPAEHKRRIRMDDAISTMDLAKQMGIKATEALKQLWGLGMTGITINTTLDYETAGVLAAEFGFEVENVAFQEEELFEAAVETDESRVSRPPVVTIMGHVDHGKTSLLDAIRKSDVVSSEAGGITQHIGAYKVKTPSGDVVFIDTPGHEAFSAMRARGANCTDIVVLVVAADDGVMPQTKEAIQHAQSAGVPIIVAVNKIDKADAQPERVRQDLTAFNLVPEDWGGDTIFCNVSAVTKQGIDQLLEMLTVQAEMLELTANPDKLTKGVVLEAELDKARGPVATVIVQEGTLRTGDIIVAGEVVAKVRALVDDRGRTVKEAPPSTPVQVLGLNGVPEAGELFNGVKDEKDAKRVAAHRQDQRRRREVATAGPGPSLLERLARGEQMELKIVLKADQQGTSEAVKDALLKLSTEKVELTVVQASVGAINESDINLAKASGAMVVGFHVRPTKQARDLAERETVDIQHYNIIYEMLDEVKNAMRGLLPKERTEKVVGRIEVRDTFTIPKQGTIAGCMVIEGKVNRASLLRVFRNNVQAYEGKVSSLRRFKDDVKEVEKGYECGLGIENFNDIKVDDLIEAFEIEETAADL